MTAIPKRVEVDTYEVSIYVGGEFEFSDACQISGDYCDSVGLCVSVSKAKFIYTDGGCDGVRVGLINYGRFPSSPDNIFAHAEELAKRLVVGLDQESASIVATDKTVWISRREEGRNDTE